MILISIFCCSILITRPSKCALIKCLILSNQMDSFNSNVNVKIWDFVLIWPKYSNTVKEIFWYYNSTDYWKGEGVIERERGVWEEIKHYSCAVHNCDLICFIYQIYLKINYHYIHLNHTYTPMTKLSDQLACRA